MQTLTRAWQQARSEFNHAWLKNRVLITLCKAKNVLAGIVEDEKIWEDLDGLLNEWRVRRGEAEQIVADFTEAASPARDLKDMLLPSLDPDIREWLSEVVVQRWVKIEHVGFKVSRVTEALSLFDSEVQNFASVLAAFRSGEGAANAEASLVNFQAATREFAEALSGLAPP